MSMQSLDQLIARSIVDPTIVQKFMSGQVDEMLGEMDFQPELTSHLCSLKADTFAEFAILAFRVVSASEVTTQRIELPSPMDGLVSDSKDSGKEHVA